MILLEFAFLSWRGGYFGCNPFQDVFGRLRLLYEVLLSSIELILKFFEHFTWFLKFVLKSILNKIEYKNRVDLLMQYLIFLLLFASEKLTKTRGPFKFLFLFDLFSLLLNNIFQHLNLLL